MTLAVALLKRLAGISSPGASGANGSSSSAATAGGVDFASMLSKVEQGQASSGIVVTGARGLQAELSGAEITALSRAADLAEASGATTAAVRMGGKVYTVDVGVRQVTSVQPVGNQMLTGIDALIDLDARTQAGTPASASTSGLATQHGLNPSLRNLLANLESAA